MNNSSSNFFDDVENAIEREDLITAHTLLLQKAELGEPDAQYLLGFMYEDGTGVSQDIKEATKWYRLAAKQGDVDAQYHLGLIYDQVVPKDHKEAVKWWKLAAEQRHERAQFNLEMMHGNSSS